jgi:DNA polymerase-3 subunit delta'
MLFKDIVGHEAIKDRLIQTVAEQRVSHAQLFLGPEGSGSLPLAIAFAQYLNCTNRQPDDACGECPSCQKFQKLIHPDLHFVFPLVSSLKNPVSESHMEPWREQLLTQPYFSQNQWVARLGAENKQGFISKDEANHILRKMAYKTYEGEYKVLILWLPEKLNAYAANALLKLVEEPPEKTIFLLVSEQHERILPTILSRTQMLRIPKIGKLDLARALHMREGVPQDEAADMAQLADGNYVLALEHIRESTETREYFEQFVALMRMAFKRDIASIVSWVDKIHSWGRERQKAFLTYALRMLRENFMLQQKQTQLAALTKNENNFAAKFHPYIHEQNVFQLNAEINEAIADIEMNGYGKTILLDLALRIVKLIRS